MSSTSPPSSPPSFLSYVASSPLPNRRISISQLSYRQFNILSYSPSLQRQRHLRPSSPIATSEDLDNTLLEACTSAKVVEKKSTRFINRKVDVATESAANRKYFEEVSASDNSSDSDLDSISTPDLFDNTESNSANKKILEALLTSQLPRRFWGPSQKSENWLEAYKTNYAKKKLVYILKGAD